MHRKGMTFPAFCSINHVACNARDRPKLESLQRRWSGHVPGSRSCAQTAAMLLAGSNHSRNCGAPAGIGHGSTAVEARVTDEHKWAARLQAVCSFLVLTSFACLCVYVAVVRLVISIPPIDWIVASFLPATPRNTVPLDSNHSLNHGLAHGSLQGRSRGLLPTAESHP